MEPGEEGETTQMYDTTQCFFCQSDGENLDKLFVMTTHRSHKFLKALQDGKHPNLADRYNAALLVGASDLKYHRSCWIECVKSDKNISDTNSNSNDVPMKSRELIEWETLQWVESSLHSGDALSIVDILSKYKRALYANNVCDSRSEDDKRKRWRELVLKTEADEYC